MKNDMKPWYKMYVKGKYLRCQITGNKQAKLECSKMAEYLTTMTIKKIHTDCVNIILV